MKFLLILISLFGLIFAVSRNRRYTEDPSYNPIPRHIEAQVRIATNGNPKKYEKARRGLKTKISYHRRN